MKAICFCNYLSEGSLLLLGEHTAYHHLIYKAQVLKCARVHWRTLCITKGETRVEAHYIHGIINSLFNMRCRWVWCTWRVRRVRCITKCFCALKLPDCSFVNSLRVGVSTGGGMCGAGACATVIVLSLNSWQVVRIHWHLKPLRHCAASWFAQSGVSMHFRWQIRPSPVSHSHPPAAASPRCSCGPAGRLSSGCAQ